MQEHGSIARQQDKGSPEISFLYDFRASFVLFFILK